MILDDIVKAKKNQIRRADKTYQLRGYEKGSP